MVRFLHTADWQIGKPYGRVPEGRKRVLLQQERLHAIGRIAAVARERQVAFVLVAGDLFDSPTVPPEAVLEVLEAIGAMERPVLVIPGNHDHGAPGSVWHRADFLRERQRLAPALQVLLQPGPVVVEVAGSVAVVLPCPLLRRADHGDPAAWIAGLDPAALPVGGSRIVLAHGGVTGFSARDYDEEAQEGAANRIDLAALAAAPVGVDYVALGDWHNLRQVGPAAWYSGTPEPDRFDQGEGERRGQVLVVELERGAPPKVEPVATGRFAWHNLSFRFGDDGDLDRFEQRLQELLGERVGRDLLRLEVAGSLSLAGHRRYDALIERLELRLLRLRRKGRCDQAPGASELEALTLRPGDPLIARVATELRDRLATQEAEGDEPAAAVSRAALCDLFRLVTAD